MTPERWRQHDATLFVEAYNEATVAGTPCRWRSLYVVELAGDLVLRGQRYYDRAPLFAALDGALPLPPPLRLDAAGLDAAPPAAVAGGGDSVDALLRQRAAAWQDLDAARLAAPWRDDGALYVPGAGRPLAGAEIAAFHAHLLAALGDRRVTLRVGGGDATLAFAAWHAGTDAARFDFAERFDLVDGRVLSGRMYYDRLALAAIAMPTSIT
jgi:hypothetical protein